MASNNETTTARSDMHNAEQILAQRGAHFAILDALDKIAEAAGRLREAGLHILAEAVEGDAHNLKRWADLAEGKRDRRRERAAEATLTEASIANSIARDLQSYCRCPGAYCPVHGDVPGVPT